MTNSNTNKSNLQSSSAANSRQMFFMHILPAAVAGVVLGWGLIVALYAVDGAHWSFEWDAHRDASIAQSILDGRYPEDPIFPGEASWFNPMTGAIVALVSYITHLTPPEAVVKIGPWLNLLAPIGFYLLLAGLFDGRVALAGLCLFLFGKDPAVLSCIRATYMPWLMAPWYAPGLFCLTLLMFHKARARQQTDYYALTGILHGLTFLCHTAPAVFAGAVMVIMVVSDACAAWHGSNGVRSMLPSLQRFFVLLIIAFLISLPYSGPILWKYQFHVVNVWPTLFATVYVELQAWSTRAWEAVNWRNAIVGIGVLALLRRRRETGAVMILGLFATAAVFLAQHYCWQVLLRKNIVLPAIVPGHHAVIYLTLAQAALFGSGAVACGHLIWRFVVAVRNRLFKCNGCPHNWIRETIVWAVAALLCVPLYGLGGWQLRTEFKPIFQEGYAQLNEQQIPIYNWIMENTAPTATFLCTEEGVGISTVMPAARKLVSTMIFYHNPYVSMGPAMEAQRLFTEAIDAGDRAGFYLQAKAYPDLYVLIRDEADAARHAHLDEMLPNLLRINGYSLYRVLPTHAPSEEESNQT